MEYFGSKGMGLVETVFQTLPQCVFVEMEQYHCHASLLLPW